MNVQELIDELSTLPRLKKVSVGNFVDWVEVFSIVEHTDHVEIMIEGTLSEED